MWATTKMTDFAESRGEQPKPYLYKKQVKGKKLKDMADDGRPIRYKYGFRKKCVKEPCPYAHVCRICEGPHPHTECPNA